MVDDDCCGSANNDDEDDDDDRHLIPTPSNLLNRQSYSFPPVLYGRLERKQPFVASSTILRNVFYEVHGAVITHVSRSHNVHMG